MSRVVKPGPVRREELLDAAHALFMARGYDATSVSDVIGAVGLSKGAFYHHFPSKEALLLALVERMSAAGLTAVAATVARADLAPRDKLAAFFAQAHATKRAHAPEVRAAWRALAAPANLALRRALTRQTTARAAPLLARVLAEGVAARVFDCPPTEAWAAFMLSCAAAYQDDLLDAVLADALDDAGLAERTDALAEAIARLTGDRGSRPVVLPPELVRELR